MPFNFGMAKNIVIILIIFLLTKSCYATDKAGEEINWQVISSGGTSGISTYYQLSGTVAQTVVGLGSSENFGINHGYWQNFREDSCDCIPGDDNADEEINIFDITYETSFLYLGGPAPIPYELCSGDPNCDCVCNIFDVTCKIDHLYMGGPAPCSCDDWIDACGELRK